MIEIIFLFFLVVVVSFFLAYRSMRDYKEEVGESDKEYSLFLIRNTQNLTQSFLQSIKDLLKSGKIISFERLFKGTNSALVVFGPKKILLTHASNLGLVELEDYTKDKDPIGVFEMGSKDLSRLSESVFTNFPKLSEDEQIFWQVSLKPEEVNFMGQIRVVILSSEIRRKQITNALQNLRPDTLIKVPRPYSKQNLFQFYKSRSVDSKASLKVNFKQLLNLIKLS